MIISDTPEKSLQVIKSFQEPSFQRSSSNSRAWSLHRSRNEMFRTSPRKREDHFWNGKEKWGVSKIVERGYSNSGWNDLLDDFYWWHYNSSVTTDRLYFCSLIICWGRRRKQRVQAHVIETKLSSEELLSVTTFTYCVKKVALRWLAWLIWNWLLRTDFVIIW